MKVALITSMPGERCGIAEYAQNLIDHAKDVEFTVLDAKQGWDYCCVNARGIDVVHVNYEPGVVPWLDVPQALHLKNEGHKIVMTLHTSMADGNSSKLTDCFDKVVVHEPCSDLALMNFAHIPHGIRVVKKPTNIKNGFIASVGFPFPWKNFPIVTKIAKELKKQCLLIMPESGHAAVETVKEQCLSANPDTEFITDWLPQDEILKVLSECDATVFPYETGNYGISGAIRFGIGAKRPVILSTGCRQFRDLDKYDAKGIWFSDIKNMTRVTKRAIEDGSYAEGCIEEQSWERCANLYTQLYSRLLE